MAGPMGSLLCANVSDDDDDIIPNHRVLTHFQLANKHLRLDSSRFPNGKVALRQRGRCDADFSKANHRMCANLPLKNKT